MKGSKKYIFYVISFIITASSVFMSSETFAKSTADTVVCVINGSPTEATFTVENIESAPVQPGSYECLGGGQSGGSIVFNSSEIAYLHSNQNGGQDTVEFDWIPEYAQYGVSFSVPAIAGNPSHNGPYANDFLILTGIEGYGTGMSWSRANIWAKNTYGDGSDVDGYIYVMSDSGQIEGVMSDAGSETSAPTVTKTSALWVCYSGGNAETQDKYCGNANNWYQHDYDLS